MPVISFEVPDFLRLYGNDLPTDRLTATLPMLGGDLDGVDGDTVHIEYFPDRPDLVSVEGIARAMRAFTGIEPGLSEYKLAPAKGDLKVDPSVAPVRPFIVMCRVEGLGPLGDARLKGLMDFQEKLGYGIGRRRRRVAIGIHDAAHVKGPYTYTTVDADHSFHPLQADRPMTVREVLTQHPKGQAYAHLLPENGPYPVILDKDGHLLSLPPVINGKRTELTVDTTDLILDLTGPDPQALRTSMAILVTAFADRGARVIPFHVHYPQAAGFADLSGQAITTPDLAPRGGTVRVSETERVLGFGLDADEVVRCLRLLGHDANVTDDRNVIAIESPAWRADILHEWDYIEDIAKGYGYNNVADLLPTATTFGATHPNMRRAAIVRTALTGHGYLEATTLTLSNERDQYDRFDLPRPQGKQSPAGLAKALTEDHTAMRVWLTPSLFHLLAANRHRDYPQALFEVGQVVDPARGHHNAWRLAALKADAKAGFTQIKGLALALLEDLAVTADVEEDDHPAFVPGRVARLVTGGRVLGRFGEYHPRVLERYEIQVPVAGLEFDLDALLPHPA